MNNKCNSDVSQKFPSIFYARWIENICKKSVRDPLVSVGSDSDQIMYSQYLLNASLQINGALYIHLFKFHIIQSMNSSSSVFTIPNWIAMFFTLFFTSS